MVGRLWLDEMLGVTFPVSFKANSNNGSVSEPEFLRKIDNFVQWLEAQEEVNHVTSLAHTMKNLNKSMHGDDPEWEAIPESEELSSQYLFFYEMSLPMGLDMVAQPQEGCVDDSFEVTKFYHWELDHVWDSCECSIATGFLSDDEEEEFVKKWEEQHLK